jgi:hypothetical protein
LTSIWIPGERVFEAAVDVCSVAVITGTEQKLVELHVGRGFTLHSDDLLVSSDEATWSRFLAVTAVVPQRRLSTSGVIRDVADGTSDFSDFYYDIAPHVIDQVASDELRPKLLTVGLIDVAVIHWGRQATRLNRQKYEHPRVILADLAPKARQRAESRLVPKVVVATQTKTLEAAVDEHGIYVPSVPVVSLIPRTIDVWHLAAAVNAPPVLLVAAQRHSGGALSSDALRLSSRDCLDLPLPGYAVAWDEAARMI